MRARFAQGVWAAVLLAVVLLLPGVGRRPAAAAAAGAGDPRIAPVGSDFGIGGTGATGDDWEPAIAFNSDAGEYLVVWDDGRNEATRGSDIYGRRVSAAGVVLGSDFRISGPGATGDDESVAVVWNANANEYFVVWSDHRSGGRGFDIYGRRVSAAGAVVGKDFRICGAGAVAEDMYPAVAWNSTADEYLVVWQDLRNSGTRGSDIFGRRVSAAGVLLGNDFRIVGARAEGHDWEPAVAFNSNAGEYLVVWDDGRNEATRGSDIYGRRVSGAGAVLGKDVRVSGPQATTDDESPAVVWNADADGFFVVWSDWRNEAGRGADIYGRRLSAVGAPLGGDIRVSGPGATGNDILPAVAWDADADRYLVVWEDRRTAPAKAWGRVVPAVGSPAGADFRISDPGAVNSEWDMAVAWNSSSAEFLVVWDDGRNATTRGRDIYGRRVAG
jgi:hypothetical protein